MCGCNRAAQFSITRSCTSRAHQIRKNGGINTVNMPRHLFTTVTELRGAQPCRAAAAEAAAAGAAQELASAQAAAGDAGVAAAAAAAGLRERLWAAEEQVRLPVAERFHIHCRLLRKAACFKDFAAPV